VKIVSQKTALAGILCKLAFRKKASKKYFRASEKESKRPNGRAQFKVCRVRWTGALKKKTRGASKKSRYNGSIRG